VLIEELNAFVWPPEYQTALAELSQLVGKYKFKEAQPVIEKLLTKIEANV
jgi:hypothetical protein